MSTREEKIEQLKEITEACMPDVDPEVSATYDWVKQDTSPFILEDEKITFADLGYDYFKCTKCNRDGIRLFNSDGPVAYTSKETAEEVIIEDLMD